MSRLGEAQATDIAWGSWSSWGCELWGPAMAMVELSQGRTGGWVEVPFARLSDVSAVRQLRLSVDAKPVSLGEPLFTAVDAAALLSVRP